MSDRARELAERRLLKHAEDIEHTMGDERYPPPYDGMVADIRSLIGSSPATDTDREKRLAAMCVRWREVPYGTNEFESGIERGYEMCADELEADIESEAKRTEAK